MKKLFIVFSVICLMLFAGNAMAQTAVAGANADANATSEGSDVTVNFSEGFASPQLIEGDVSSVNREFVVPGGIPFPQTNGFFTSPTPDSSFRSAKELVRFGSKFTVGALKKMAEGGDVDVNYTLMNDTVKLSDEELNYDTRYMVIVLDDGKIEGFSSRAMVDAEADDANTNSVQVIAALALKAFNDGCNTLVLTAEGAHRAVEAKGWGIGFYTVGGTIGNQGIHSANGGGGTGWAHNETTPEDRPWVQGYAGVMDGVTDKAVNVKE